MLTVYDDIVIGCYLIFLAGIGWFFHRSGRTSDEFFRGGGQMKWWLVGASTFMASFSAHTFTGAASLAYTNGIVVLIIYLANVLVFVIHWLWLAPWFRQTRMIVMMEVVRIRLGKVNEQFFTWTQLPLLVALSGIALYGLAVFCAPVFGFDVRLMIVISGSVVIFMAVSGGSWAVTVGDFLQSLMLIPITIVVAVGSLAKVGGLHGLLTRLPSASLDPVASHAPGYGGSWALAIAVDMVLTGGLLSAGRYLGVKNGKEARQAALLAALLCLLASVIWFIPPLAAKALNLDLASQFPGLIHPAEGSYIAMARLCLPAGLMGILVTGIMSTTISSMDMGLNRNSGTFVRSFYLPILRPEASEKELVAAGRISTLVLGLLIVGMALLYSTWSDYGLLRLMLNFGALIVVPTGVPMFLCLVVRRAPDWAAWSSVLAGFAADELFGLFHRAPFLKALADGLRMGGIFDRLASRDFATTALVNAALCAAWYLAALWAFPLPAGSQRQKEIDQLFAAMKKPLESSEEADPGAMDVRANSISKLAVAYGLFAALLLFIPNHWQGRAGILFCAAFVAGFGVLIRWNLGKPGRGKPI